MAVNTDEPDFSKSTGAFPMGPEPEPVVVDSGVDFSKSTGAYPMYDSGNQEVTVPWLGQPAEQRYVTPGPRSHGIEASVKRQRADLGLSEDDFSGEADAGYAARPTTVKVPGADGVDREEQTTSRTKVVDASGVVAKVVESPDDGGKPSGKTKAEGK